MSQTFRRNQTDEFEDRRERFAMRDAGRRARRDEFRALGFDVETAESASAPTYRGAGAVRALR